MIFYKLLKLLYLKVCRVGEVKLVLKVGLVAKKTSFALFLHVDLKN